MWYCTVILRQGWSSQFHFYFQSSASMAIVTNCPKVMLKLDNVQKQNGEINFLAYEHLANEYGIYNIEAIVVKTMIFSVNSKLDICHVQYWEICFSLYNSTWLNIYSFLSKRQSKMNLSAILSSISLQKLCSMSQHWNVSTRFKSQAS